MSQGLFRAVTYIVLLGLTLNFVCLPSANGQSLQSKSNDTSGTSRVPNNVSAMFARINEKYVAERLHKAVEPGLKSENQSDSAKLYDIAPSRVRRDRRYDVSIRALDCQKNELAGARLSVLDNKGLSFSSIETKGCFLNARLAVSKTADLGRTAISIQGTQGLLGRAYVTVEDLGSFDLSSHQTTPKKKSWAARNWWTIPLIGGLAFGTVKAIQYGVNHSGSGYDVVCNDGTTSHAGGKQGACSSHGGVRP